MGVATRVVSMPCLEWFGAQDDAYRESVLPPACSARVSVEAGIAHVPGAIWSATTGRVRQPRALRRQWRRFQVLFEQFGFTADNAGRRGPSGVAVPRRSDQRLQPTGN